MQEILKEIQRKREALPLAQKTVADYILDHYKDVPFLTVTSLADAIGVSDTTIIKFSIKLGFDGYSGFRKALSEFVQTEMTMYSHLENRLEALAGQSTLDQVLSFDRSNVEMTLQNPQNRLNFDRLIAMLDRATTIYVCGFRTAAMQAEFLAASLTQQNRRVVTITPGSGHFTDQLGQITKDDLLIAFVFSRYSTEVIKALTLMRRSGIPCAAITDSLQSPAYGCSDVSFLCETRSCNYQASYAGCTALMNAIITGSSISRKEETKQFLKRLEDLFVEFDTFYHG